MVLAVGVPSVSVQTCTWLISDNCYDVHVFSTYSSALDFSSYPFKLFIKIEILTLSNKHWNSAPIFIKIEILTLSNKHWNSSPIFVNIGIMILSIQTLGFWPYVYKHWNFGPFFINIGILAFFFL